MLRGLLGDYGRLIPKPAPPVDDNYFEDHLEDVTPIQEQLEAISVKIHLKELYNHVLKDELEESRRDSSSILKDLQLETKKLHLELTDAFNAEKTAVHKALRTHREFQLAMTERTGRVAIPWLDDKVFDISRRLNILNANLAEKRKRLEAAERIIDQIERWPRPGSLPWEIAATAAAYSYESQIESMKIKLETVNILHDKYVQIQNLLKEERGKFHPIMGVLLDQSKLFSSELAELQKTLKETVAFRDSAVRNLVLTQKEASENRRRRRLQMVKMKSAVRHILESSTNSSSVGISTPKVKGQRTLGHQSLLGVVDSATVGPAVFAQMIQYKRAEIEKFEERAELLVATMRVSDLSLLPARFQSVMSLGDLLGQEVLAKEELLHTFIQQRAQLHILSVHFNYTGQNVTQDFLNRRNQYMEAIEGTVADRKELEQKLNSIGDTILRIRMGTLRILEQLEGRGGKIGSRLSPNVQSTLRIISEKVKRLMEVKETLMEMIGTGEAGRNYGAFVQEPTVPGRLYRVAGSAEAESGGSDEDDEVIDIKVATRLDMKVKSLRFIHHAKLRKGMNK